MRFWKSCWACGNQIAFSEEASHCSCGGSFLIDYDLENVKMTLTKENLKSRPTSIWRYRELLPVKEEENIVSMGEGWTPLIRLFGAEKHLPLQELWIKREELNPTGSFKARGFAVAISIAKERGVRKVAVNSNGNAAVALAAYASFVGMESYVFVPKDCPGLIIEECMEYGAHTVLVDGYIHDAGKIILNGEKEQQWYNVGTLKEPGRVEGKKTMGLELAEQFDWRLPDVIIYPTGGGSGVIGMWRAFHQLNELGLIPNGFPRIVSVQEAGCAPLVDAMKTGGPFTQSIAVHSNPTGMRVPDPPDGELLLHILRETGGTAVAVSHDEIQNAQRTLGLQGISASPEGAATWAGLLRLINSGWIHTEDRVVLFNTSHSMKYLPWNKIKIQDVKDYMEWKKQL